MTNFEPPYVFLYAMFKDQHYKWIEALMSIPRKQINRPQKSCISEEFFAFHSTNGNDNTKCYAEHPVAAGITF